jgi:hypothetical protein
MSGGLRFGRFGGDRRWVLDAGTDKAYEGSADSFAGFVDLTHRQLALVELAVLELRPDGAGDDVLDALGGRLLQDFTVASTESASIRMPASLLFGRGPG